MRDLADPDPALAWARPLRARDPARAAALGAWPTPRALADRMASYTVHALPPEGRVLDPACGGGMLLRAVAERLWAEAGAVRPGARAELVRRRLRGWDVDPEAVDATRRTLAAAAGTTTDAVAEVVEERDALAPGEAPSFAAVILNPPWVDATRMHRAEGGAERRAELAARYASARGAWDLYCPFVERAVDLATPGGRVVALVPDKVLASPYAAALRDLLRARTTSLHQERHEDAALGVAARAVCLVLAVGAPGAKLAPSQRAPGPTVGDLAQVHGAATVAEAYAWAPLVREGQPGPGLAPLVNTGTLAPWSTRWGERPLRYLGARWLHPVVPLDGIATRRATVAGMPKLVLPGLTRRLMVLPDLEGRWLPAKSTVVVRPEDPADLGWLAGWLGSAAATRTWEATWPGLTMRGGWHRVGVRELAALPVPDFTRADREELAACVGALARAPSGGAGARLDAIVDAAVERAR